MFEWFDRPVLARAHKPLKKYFNGITRVAKCQIFYTDQFFPNEFTPRKSVYIVINSQPKIHEVGKEGKIRGKTTKDDIIETVLKTKRHVSC